MSISANILRRIAALRLSRAQSAEVLSIVAEIEEAHEARKEKDRLRKIRGKSVEIPPHTETGKSTEIPVEIPDGGSLDKREIPQTPLEKTTPSLLASLGEKPPSSRARPASRIPDDFEPDLSVAQTLGLTFDQAMSEAENFKDYWRSKAGNATKRDWLATWRVWCRKAEKQPNGASRNGYRTGSANTGKPAAHDAIHRAVAEQFAPRDGLDERAPDADAGLFDEPGTAPADRGARVDLEAADYRRR